MNLRQLEHAIKLAEVRSFSQLAEKLDISQPALSKQILSLETELGVKLFDRNTTPLELTPAGEEFIIQAKELLYLESQLIRSMEQFSSGEAGKLTIGVSPFRSVYLLPKLLKKVRNAYPKVKIVLHEASSEELRKEAAEGKYDFAIVNMPVDESQLDVIPIASESLVLAVPDKYVDMLDPKARESSEISFSACKDLPFVVVGQSQEMRAVFDNLCAMEAVVPDIAAEVVGLNTARALVCEGIGATLLPMQVVDGENLSGKITVFKIKDYANIRQPVIVTKRGQYISEYVKFAVDVLINM